MEDIVNPPVDEDKTGDIIMQKLKPLVPDQMRDVRRVSRDEVVDTPDAVPFPDEAIAEV